MTEPSTRILVVDDDEGHAETLADALEVDGYECTVAGSGVEGVAAMKEQSFDVVLTDLVMHDLDGLEVLDQARDLLPGAAVLVVTGHASWETARDAMMRGAETYLSKPVNLGELRSTLVKVVEKVRLRRENEELQRENVDLRRQIDKRFGFEGILGHSPQMLRVFEVLAQVSEVGQRAGEGQQRCVFPGDVKPCAVALRAIELAHGRAAQGGAVGITRIDDCGCCGRTIGELSQASAVIGATSRADHECARHGASASSLRAASSMPCSSTRTRFAAAPSGM